MGQILQILNLRENESFESNVHPRHRYLDQISALLNHGPAGLDKYHYFYGLLDCASQLGRIIDPKRYPAGVEERMRQIIERTQSNGEASFRWKAVSAFSPERRGAKPIASRTRSWTDAA